MHLLGTTLEGVSKNKLVNHSLQSKTTLLAIMCKIGIIVKFLQL